MNVDRLTVDAADGRRLAALAAGPRDGMPLVFHHGTPAGLVPLQPLIEAAAARGLRTVMYARPGYGGSTALPGRSVADAAGDVAAILAELRAPAFMTVGWSGGGPHALACAGLLRGRCLAAASVAGVAPAGASGLDWLAGMGAENVEEFSAARAGEESLMPYLEAQAAVLREVSAAEVAGALAGLISEADTAVLDEGFAAFLAESFRAAVSSGIAGWRDDDLAFVRDWGFPLDTIGAAAIWQGDQDRMVPYAHGAWLASHVPGARARLRTGAGHLTFAVTGWGDILDDLTGLAGI